MREPGDMVTQGCGEGLLAVLGLMQLGTWKWEKIRRRWERKCRGLVAYKVVEISC